MPDALAIAALLISLAALLIALRAATAVPKAPVKEAPPAVPAASASPSRGTPSPAPPTDPSVLVRLDALESRQASLELRASLAAGDSPPVPASAAAGSREGSAGDPDPARRPHPMFP